MVPTLIYQRRGSSIRDSVGIGKKNGMYHLYILKLMTGSYYVGSTGNLESRLKAHMSGKVFYTKSRLPAELVYTEKYLTRSEAQTREYQIKSWKKRKAIEKLFTK